MISDTSHFSSQIHFTLHSLRTDSKGLTPTTLEQNVLSLLLPRSNALNSIQSWWSKYRKQVLTRANQYLNCCERTTSKELTSTEKHLVATDVEEKVLSRHFSEWEECCINFLLQVIGLKRLLSISECRCFYFSVDEINSIRGKLGAKIARSLVLCKWNILLLRAREPPTGPKSKDLHKHN